MTEFLNSKDNSEQFKLPLKKLGDIADVTKLAGFEFTKHIDYVENGDVIALRSLNVVDGHLDLTNIKRITKDASDSLPRSKLFINDILLTYTGSKLGDTAIIDKDDTYHLAPNVCRLRALEPEDSEYLYVYLRSDLFKAYLEGYKVGSGQPTVPMKNIRRIPIPWPEKTSREVIASCYQSFNRKSVINKKICQNLEQITQAIFKSWFVDFEPVKAKIAVLDAGGSESEALGNAMQAISGKNADQLATMKAQQPSKYADLRTIADLFPAAMQDSELSEIPLGWEYRDIDTTTSLIIDHRGKTPKKLGGDWSETGYIALSAKHIKNGHIVNREQLRCVNEDLYAKWMKEELQKGDILLTSEGPMGEMYYLSGDEKYCLSQRLYALRADAKRIHPSFLYYWLNSPNARADMEGRATGTTVVGIRQSELRKVKVICPPKLLTDAFGKVAQSSLDTSASLTRETLVLSAMRDLLLPRLLSGELMVEGDE